MKQLQEVISWESWFMDMPRMHIGMDLNLALREHEI